MASRTNTVSSARECVPAAPAHEDQREATALLDQVLRRQVIALDELRSIADRHVDRAPVSSAHVSKLAAILSKAVLDWIQDWPT